MGQLIQVKDNPGLFRDTASKAIIVDDRDAYLKARAERLKQCALENRINNLEHDIQEIKHGLAVILDALKGNNKCQSTVS